MSKVPQPALEKETKTKYLEIKNIGSGSVVIASLLEELDEGHELAKGEKFVLDIDSNRAEYIRLDKVLVHAVHGMALVQITYIDEVQDGND